MIIYKNIDTVWINTTDGVTVYFSHNYLAGYMSAYVRTPCGVPQIQPFGECKSVEDGRKQLGELTQSDADRLFKEIRSWKSNKQTELKYFQDASCVEPI